MSAARRAELYATLARETAAQARALAKQARAFAELAHLEGHPGVETGDMALPANDESDVAAPIIPAGKPKVPRKRPARAMPLPDPSIEIDEVTRARTKRILRRMGIVT